MLLLPPVRFRFCEDDRAEYGDGWTTYDEAALLRLPARELIEVERRIGMAVLTMLDRARANFTDANLAAMWVARRIAGDERPFDKFQPLALMVEWELTSEGRGALLARRKAILAELEKIDERLADETEDRVPADDVDPPASTSSPAPSGE